MGVTELVKDRKQCIAIQNKWVYMKKRDVRGNLNRSRGRLVAKRLTKTGASITMKPSRFWASILLRDFPLTWVAQQSYEMIPIGVKVAFFKWQIGQGNMYETASGCRDDRKGKTFLSTSQSVVRLEASVQRMKDDPRGATVLAWLFPVQCRCGRLCLYY